MAGHNKWNNIKNRKGAQDQKRSKAFFDVLKMVRVAVKEHQTGNPDMNPGLRLALEKARAVNMPKETIQRAIDRALGKGEAGQQIQEVTYEGYGPHGIGFLVIAATDNVQRTASNVRYIFSRHGGSLAGPGAVMFMFTRQGTDFKTTMPISLTAEQAQDIQDFEDALMEDDDVEEVFHNAVWEK